MDAMQQRLECLRIVVARDVDNLLSTADLITEARVLADFVFGKRGAEEPDAPQPS